LVSARMKLRIFDAMVGLSHQEARSMARREGFLVRFEHIQNDGSVQIEDAIRKPFLSRLPADLGTLVARVRNGFVESVEVYEQEHQTFLR
jgi:hypothetical protein